MVNSWFQWWNFINSQDSKQEWSQKKLNATSSSGHITNYASTRIDSNKKKNNWQKCKAEMITVHPNCKPHNSLNYLFHACAMRKTAANEHFKREIHKMFKTVTALEVSNKIRSMKHNISKRIGGNHLLWFLKLLSTSELMENGWWQNDRRLWDLK